MPHLMQRAVAVDMTEPTANDRFFAHMSHELRTPVNAVLGYATLLLDGVAGSMSATATDMVTRIASSAQHLRALVDELLDLGRLEAGKTQLRIGEVFMPALLRETLASLEAQAAGKGLTLELEAADVPRLDTDATRVRQIVLNLVSNALKFTECGGVTVRLERLAADAIAVHVVDTGVGIASADLDRVFDEFVQVGRVVDGTGLGLTISRRLARLLGGDLTVRSTPARGSCFTLTLPTTAAPSVTRSPERERALLTHYENGANP